MSTIAAPTILTLCEAAEFLKVSTRTLYSLTAPRGPIRCLRVGPRGVRYTMAALQRFIAEQEAGGSLENRSAPNGCEENAAI